MPLRSDSIEWRRPPRRDEVEVTIFGPGYGECIVIHLGGGKWVVIDSCIDSDTTEPAALSYLRSIGYHPPDAVKMVIATHWHDDHICGMAEIVRVCRDARFCCSSAFTKTEFQSLLEALNGLCHTVSGSGAHELYRVSVNLELTERIMRIANANKLILRVPAADTVHGLEAVVHSLSPSDDQMRRFIAGLAPLILSARNARRARDQSPNHLTVVTWIEIGSLKILCGGDLEETGSPQTGWSAIVASAERPPGRAGIFKVPHHGSETAHLDEVWKEMLVANPFALIAPWTLAGANLPTSDDLERLTGLSERVFLTAMAQSPKSAKRFPPAVARQLREMNVVLRREPRTGAIRLRGHPEALLSQWSIELRGEAHRVMRPAA